MAKQNSSWMEQGYHPPRQPLPARQPACPPQQPAYTAPPPQQPVYAQQTINVNVNVSGGGRSESYFDGGVLSLLGLEIVNFFIILLTAGICYPWSICRKYRWEQQHTVLDGRRLVFDGTAMGLFGTWIRIWFLCLVTLGIYILWARISVKRWITRHTHLS